MVHQKNGARAGRSCTFRFIFSQKKTFKAKTTEKMNWSIVKGERSF